jgi:hypothetical protein
MNRLATSFNYLIQRKQIQIEDDDRLESILKLSALERQHRHLEFLQQFFSKGRHDFLSQESHARLDEIYKNLEFE